MQITFPPMECSICFGECENQCTLTCTHAFCFPCLRKWMESPTQLEGPSCPMCRGPVLFKGLRKIQGVLEEKRWDAAYDDKYAELFDDLLEETMRMSKLEARVWNLHGARVNSKAFVSRRCMIILQDMEKTFGAMKTMDEHPEMIGSVILDTDINYKKEVLRMNREQWKGREPSRVRAPQRRTQMRRFV